MFDWMIPLLNAEGEIGASTSGNDVVAPQNDAPPSVEGEGENPSVDGSAPKPEASGDKPTDESSFAKRLREHSDKRIKEEREKWEAERQAELEKYKDHDAYKKAAEYLQRTSGINDIMTLKEEIELAELQERAEKEKVPPSVLKRIDELEAKAARGEELEAAQKQEQERQEFENTLKDFCKDKQIDGKPVDHMELWKYMHENTTSNPDVALKAMKADILEAKLETAKTDAVNEYLQSKQAPKTEGSQGAAAQQAPGRAGSIDAAEQRALARLRAAREAQ